MVNSLRGVNILLARQEQHAVKLIHLLASINANCVCQPLFAIESILEPLLQQTIDQQIKTAALAIFVSRNAAEIVLPHLALDLPVRWASMGPTTADYLHAQGLSQVIYPLNAPFDSMSLIKQLVINGISLNAQKVILFTGENGNTWLTEELQRQGADPLVVAVYKRVLPDISASHLAQLLNTEPAIDIIVITCVTSLLNLKYLMHDSMGEALYLLPLLVVSARIEKQALDIGFLNVYTANSMSDEDVLSALVCWHNLING